MPQYPSAVGSAALLAATTQNGTIVAPACQSGDLLVLAAGKRASSGFTFPAGFQMEYNAAPFSGMAAALGWKWATEADSGASNVVSTSGAGNLLHGRALVFRDVQSTATPLRGLITEVASRNYIRAGSLTNIGDSIGACIAIGFDNPTPTVTGFTANSWVAVSSGTTTTGSDGSFFAWTKPLQGSSGGQFNPNSTAGTAPWLQWSFMLAGAPVVTEPTAEDAVDLTDDVSKLMQWLVAATDNVAALDSGNRDAWHDVLASDAFSVTDARPTLTYEVMATDVLSLLDSAIADYIPGAAGPQIVTKVEGDGVSLSDGYLSVLLSWRTLEDVLSIADADQLRRICTLTTAEGTSVVDETLRHVLLGRVSDDGVVTVDAADAYRLLGRLASDSVAVADYADLWRDLRRTAEDALEVTDGSIVPEMGRILIRVLDDAADLTDYADRIRYVVSHALDALTTLDSALAYRAVTASAADSASVSDAALREVRVNRSAEDAIGVTDAADLWRRLLRVVDDALTASDTTIVEAARRIAVTIDDGFDLTDAADFQRWLTRAMLDDIATIDASLAGAVRNYAASDGAQLTDGHERAVRLTRSVQDVLAAADESFLQRNLTRWLEDTLGLADSALVAAALTRALDDAVAVIDLALTAVTGITIRVAEDGIDLSDGTQTVRLSTRVLQDGLDLNDEAIRVMRLVRLLLDGVDVQDFATADTSTIRIFTATGEDGILLTDAADLFAIRNRDLLDAVVGLLDAASYQRLYGRAADDTLQPTDNASAMLRKLLLAVDSLEVADGVATVRLYGRGLADLLDIGDDALPLYIRDVSLRYVLRVRLGAQQRVEIGAEAVAVIGYSQLPIEIGGFH